MLWLLYIPGKGLQSHSIRDCVGPRSSLDGMTKRKSLPLPEINLSCVAHSTLISYQNYQGSLSKQMLFCIFICQHSKTHTSYEKLNTQ